MGEFRTLKIHEKLHQRSLGKRVRVPAIRLEGKWLEDLGFQQGERVQIEQRKNKLIITVIKHDDNNTN